MEFEYKILSIDSRELEHSAQALTDQLNKYGREGWEPAVSFICPYIGSSQYSLISIAQKSTLILKRQIAAKEMHN